MHELLDVGPCFVNREWWLGFCAVSKAEEGGRGGGGVEGWGLNPFPSATYTFPIKIPSGSSPRRRWDFNGVKCVGGGKIWEGVGKAVR